MFPEDDADGDERDSCIIPSNPIPARELSQYSVTRDPHLEQDIANYVQGQAPDEVVQNVEKTKQEVVCPVYKSRHIRTHFDISIEPDGDYYGTGGL